MQTLRCVDMTMCARCGAALTGGPPPMCDDCFRARHDEAFDAVRRCCVTASFEVYNESLGGAPFSIQRIRERALEIAMDAVKTERNESLGT